MDVTASMLRSFKSCPKKYYFEYVEQLKPAQTPEALILPRKTETPVFMLILKVTQLMVFLTEEHIMAS